MSPRVPTPAEVNELAERVPEFAAALESSDPQPAPDWFEDHLDAARQRATGHTA